MAKKTHLISGFATNLDDHDPAVAKVLVAQLELARIERQLQMLRREVYELERRADLAVNRADEAENKLKKLRQQAEEIYQRLVKFQKKVNRRKS